MCGEVCSQDVVQETYYPEDSTHTLACPKGGCIFLFPCSFSDLSVFPNSIPSLLSQDQRPLPTLRAVSSFLPDPHGSCEVNIFLTELHKHSLIVPQCLLKEADYKEQPCCRQWESRSVEVLFYRCSEKLMTLTQKPLIAQSRQNDGTLPGMKMA